MLPHFTGTGLTYDTHNLVVVYVVLKFRLLL